jgi:hypothetical protein
MCDYCNPGPVERWVRALFRSLRQAYIRLTQHERMDS